MKVNKKVLILNLKDLIKLYSGETGMTMVSFKLAEFEKDLIEDIASQNDISRSKLLRIFVSEGLFQLFGNPKYIEEMQCPLCESKSILKINEGDKSAKGMSIYRCSNDHQFVYKSLKYNKQQKLKKFIEKD